MIPLCKDFEEKLIKHIWRTRAIARKPTSSIAPSVDPSVTNSDANLNEKTGEVSKEQSIPEPVQQKPPPKRTWWGWRLDPKNRGSASGSTDPEKKRKERKLVLLGPFYAGCGAALAACK